MKQPDKKKKISVAALKKLAKDRERAQLQEQAQNQYNEGSTTFNLNSSPFENSEGADIERKMMLLEQAEAGSEMAIYELQQAGVDIRIPDADASDLTTWLFSGPAKVGGLLTAKMAMMAGTKGPKWTKALKQMTDYYKRSGKKVPNWLSSQADDVAKEGTKMIGDGTKMITGPKGKAMQSTSKSVPKQLTGPAGPTPAPKTESMFSKMKNYGKGAWEYAKENPGKTTLKIALGKLGYEGVKDFYNYMTNDTIEDTFDEHTPITQDSVKNQKPKDDGLRTGGLKYETGGQVLEGGTKEHVAGNLFEYKGRSHEEGGIIEGDIEVEGGEMEMQDMPMADGSVSDYIFSDKLRYGGATFADAAKAKMKEGATPSDMSTLAKIQESAASNRGEKGRDPDLIMKHGGVKKMYNDGGPIYKNLGEEGLKAQTVQDSGYYASDDTKMISEEDERKDFFERNKDILVGLGIEKWDDYEPAKHASMFQSAVNTHFKEKFDNDPELQEKMKKEGIEDAGAYAKKVGFGDEGITKLDGYHGEYTNSMSTQSTKPVPSEEVVEETVDPPVDEDADVEDDVEIEKIQVEEEKSEDPVDNKVDYGPLVGAAQMLPVFAAMNDKPDYISQPDLITPGVVRAEREAKVNLDRVDYTDQLARNSQDAAALNRSIETSGGGSSNIVNKMAAFAKKKQADRQIKSDESRANTAIGNQEAGMNSQVNARNAANALQASRTNAKNILAADEANTRNKMYVDEFNRGAEAATFDRKLDALQTGTQNVAQMYRDRLSYDAETRKANAIAGETGINTREAADRMTLLYGKPKTT